MLRNVNDNNKVQAAIVTARPARVKADEKQLRRKLPKGGQRSLRDVAAEAQNQSSRVIARLPRWAGKSGSGQTRQGSDRAHVSGVPPAADIGQRGWHVGSVPFPEVAGFGSSQTRRAHAGWSFRSNGR